MFYIPKTYEIQLYIAYTTSYLLGQKWYVRVTSTEQSFNQKMCGLCFVIVGDVKYSETRPCSKRKMLFLRKAKTNFCEQRHSSKSIVSLLNIMV